MALSKDTILVIAGNEASRLSIRKSLGEAGYDVVVVPNEPAALDVLQQVSPSLIVADRNISDYERLREHKSLKVTPIVAWGGQNGECEEDCIGDIERGADLVVCSQSSRELVARVRAILQRKESNIKPTVHSAAGVAVFCRLQRSRILVAPRRIAALPGEIHCVVVYEGSSVRRRV